ncbi:MAG: energy-coupling factor transporter transmembrane component T [Planctomycetota bacterium]
MIYQPGQTVFHDMHPLVKLAWLLWGTVAVFVFDSVALALGVTGAALVLLWLAGVPPWRITGLRLWLTLSLVILAAHLIMNQAGGPTEDPESQSGLVAGLRVIGRLLAVVLMSSLFVTTTEPVKLAHALMRAGLPYRWGFTLVTALRLTPLFRMEAHHVYRAQLVRGVAYDRIGPRRWWLVARHLCLPMIVSALRMTQTLSLSMEGRAFGRYPRRTSLRTVTFGARDIMAGALLSASIALAIWCAWIKS